MIADYFRSETQKLADASLAESKRGAIGRAAGKRIASSFAKCWGSTRCLSVRRSTRL